MPPMTLRAVVAPRGPCPASHPVASTSGASTVAGLSRRHAGKSLGASRCPPRGVRGHGGALPGALERPCRAMPRRADSGGKEEPLRALGRRELGLMGLVGAPLFTAVLPADAVQGYTPGRIPGLSNLDDDGFRRYTRPEGKQGGHGVGWSEIPRYTFRVPDGYDETAVSIADLGGAEIDMRMRGPYGALMVVVAPVMRFLDVGFNADIRVEELGSPGKLLSGFAPELFGRPLEEGQVKDTRVFKGEDGLTYYWYEVSTATVPHSFVSITALKNRVFILATSSNAREFRKGREEVRSVQESFRADVTAIPGLAA